MSRKSALPLIAVLGFAIAVIPAMSSSGSTTPTISGIESNMWSPMEVTIAPGGTVIFQDTSTSDPHGIVWSGGPETPACTGVPIDTGRTNWKGSCTFKAEGTYDFYCYIHGMKMLGKVFAVASGGSTTTLSTTTGTTMGTTTSTTPTTTTTSTQPTSPQQAMSMPMGSPSSEGHGAPAVTPGLRDSLGGGSLRLPASQRGSIRGSLEVAQSGSRWEVELLVAGSALGPHHARSVLVARLQKAGVPAGRLPFVLALRGSARRALERLGRLVVSVRITLAPPGGMSVTRTLKVALRR